MSEFLRPIGKMVLVELRDKVAEKTASGLMIPRSTRSEAKYTEIRGKVVAIGEQAFRTADWEYHSPNDDGFEIVLSDPSITPGDTVLFRKNQGYMFDVLRDGADPTSMKEEDWVKYRIIRDTDVLAVLTRGREGHVKNFAIPDGE